MTALERFYLHGGERRRIEARLEGDALTVLVDGQAETFTVAPGPPGAFLLRRGDRTLAGHAVSSRSTVWVHLHGQTWVLQRDEASRARHGHAVPAGGDVISPMTGTVRKVFAEAGQSVEAGTPLLVVEAMKMEYTVTAPGEGRLAAVLCAPGQAVDLGQILVHFEPVADSGDKDSVGGRT